MKISDVLTHEEIKRMSQATDVHGYASLVTSWGLIGLSFTLAAVNLPGFAHWLAVIIALILLGGRQLALGILMHDCAHYSLFRTRWLNDFSGKWLSGYPVWQDLRRYRAHHLAHHRDAGTEKDPDASLTTGYPTSRASLVRKIFRDLVGITGVKRVFGLLAMDFGFIKYTVANDKISITSEKGLHHRLLAGVRNTYGVVLTNLILFLLLKATGHAELYALWVIAYLTTFSLFLRIRSIAEHACTTPGADPLESTRTTAANWFGRITVAPHYVNYHLEHHLLMNVPSFRLPRLHRLLRGQGHLENAHLASGYCAILKTVTNR